MNYLAVPVAGAGGVAGAAPLPLVVPLLPPLSQPATKPKHTINATQANFFMIVLPFSSFKTYAR